MAIRIALSKKLGEKRWTQRDLARKTGIRPNTINEMYHDLSIYIKLDHLDKICQVMDCEVSDILIKDDSSI